METMSPSPELGERIRWFIRLRWLAVAGILAAAGVVASLRLAIPWRNLLVLAGLLAGLNVVYAALSRRPVPPLPFTWWPILTDLTVLTLASILMPPRVSYLVAALATMFFLAMAVSEHLRLIPHTELGFVRWDNPQHLAAAATALGSTLFSSSYLASTIMEGLRRKDEEMRRFNDRLLQTEKLPPIGQPAAGMPHGMNTPLPSIAGRPEV